MGVTLINNNGSGSIANRRPISYSYSEEVTSLEPSNLTGGAGQVNVSALAVDENKIGTLHANSKLLINNSMSLIDTDAGEIKFFVKQATVTQEVVAIVGSTLEYRLNVERTAAPHGGDEATLLTAIEYYCGLVDISIANGNLVFEGGVDTDMSAVPVNFVGWTGNVWEHLKMLAAAVSIDPTTNAGFEFYVNGDSLTFREAKTTEVEFSQKNLSSQSVAVDAFDAAQSVEIYNYNTTYKENAVVQDTSLDRYKITADAQSATTSDSFQVNAGETLKKRITINASLESVNQPVAVDEIDPFPFTATHPTGQYAIAGGDGIFIKADQWVGEGGSLTVALTENPLEIEITVTAPPKNGLENINGGGELSFEPYKIAVETSGNADYPALYVTGTGVFYNKIAKKIATGASNEFTSKESASSIDNPFITNADALYTRGVAAAQAICGPKVTLNETSATSEQFGATPGKIRTVGSNKFRLTSVNYSPDNTSVNGSPCASLNDFNTIWTGLTFEDFTNTALDPVTYPEEAMKFNEFTIIPLMDAEVA